MRVWHFILLPFFLLFVGLSHAGEQIQELEQDFSDSLITTKITAKFTEDRLLNPLKIGVSTHQGTVTLTGHVRSREAFVEALRLTVKTGGVRHVDTEELHIEKVNTVFTDAWITAKVESAVLKAKVLDDESIPLAGIKAQTENGVVTLSGDVSSTDSISVLLKRIQSIRGVKKIISNIKVG